MAKRKDKYYCSNECWNKNRGGYRKGSGRSKSGYYRNIWCDSNYELAFVIYCLDHNISIKRNTEKFIYYYNNKKHYYIPDFITPDGLIEIKGWHTSLVDIKLKSVNKPIKILYKKDLTEIFDYVINKTQYKIDNLYIMYENYIPEIKKCNYVNCTNTFYVLNTNKQKIYCSISCSKVGKNKNNIVSMVD